MPLPPSRLLAHALGTLEPGDVYALEARLDPVERWRQGSLAALAGLDLAPGPGLQALASTARLLGEPGGAHHVGDHIIIHLASPVPAAVARLVVLRQAGGRLDVLHPRAASWATLDQLREVDGHPVVDLVVEPPSGLHRYDLLVLPTDLVDRPWPPNSPAWERLLRGGARGVVPAASLELEVV